MLADSLGDRKTLSFNVDWTIFFMSNDLQDSSLKIDVLPAVASDHSDLLLRFMKQVSLKGILLIANLTIHVLSSKTKL